MILVFKIKISKIIVTSLYMRHKCLGLPNILRFLNFMIQVSYKIQTYKPLCLNVKSYVSNVVTIGGKVTSEHRLLMTTFCLTSMKFLLFYEGNVFSLNTFYSNVRHSLLFLRRGVIAHCGQHY